MKKFLKIFIILIFLLIIVLGILYMIDTNRMKNNKPVLVSTWGTDYAIPVEKNQTTNMNIILSLEDNITDNSAWCGTFNLIWNDLKNELVKQDIVFTPQLERVVNLNKGTFNSSYLSEDSYYKVCGVPSLKLKSEIKQAIKEKFNETSDILDDFTWSDLSPKDYFLYTMLKKNFEFKYEFSELKNDSFGNYKNIKYFGINSDTEGDVREQVVVLYYNSNTDFAIKLLTKNNDEVIISRGNIENSFGDIYQEILEKQNKYMGNCILVEGDTLKIPNITFNLKEKMTDLQGKPFLFANGDEAYIKKAIQTIQFELDKKGGKIKSEAGLYTEMSATSIKENPREFWVNDTFNIFLKEKNKDLPYFASQISDISQLQK